MKLKANLSQQLIGRKEILELKVKATKISKARENASGQVVISFSFASDWLREWCQFSGPITERSKLFARFKRQTFSRSMDEVIFNNELINHEWIL